MSSMRFRFVSLLLLFCMLAATPLTWGDNTTAQGSLPIGEFTPALPDGPPVQIQPISTVPPETPAGVPTSEPNPNVPPPTEAPNPNEPPPTEAPNPNQPPPNEPPPPAPDEPDEPPTALPVERTPLDIPLLPTEPDVAVPIELMPATITIRTRVCDNEGFNPYFTYRSHDLAAMEAECPFITDPFGFSLYTPALALSKVTTGGVVTFDVPANTKVTLASAQPDGYDTSIYTCASPFQDRKWGVQEPTMVPMSWTTQVAEPVECTWFFVQNNDDVNLILSKAGCSWFDPATLSEATVFCDYIWSHNTWGEVTLSDTDPSTADIVRPASGERLLSFIDLPPGTYTVTETGVAAGTAWTYMGHCFIDDAADGAPKPTFPLIKSTTFSVSLPVAGDTTLCTSFNVAASGSRSVPMIEYTPAFPGGPPIDIPPVGTEPPAPDDPDAPPTGLPILPGSNRPKPNIPPLVPLTPTPALTPIFPVETEEPTATPVPPTVVTGSGNLTIYSRTCDNQGFNPHFGGTLATFLAECPAADREFEFRLWGSVGSSYTKTVSTKGGVINEVVPAPGLGFRRSEVPGFDLSFTSCSNDSFNKDAPKSIAHYSGAAIAAGESVTCYWFNVLDSTDINISVSTYACPAVSPLTTPTVIPTDFELQSICTTWPITAGVTVTLADGDSATADQVKVTGTEAGAQFIDLPVGTYTITITPPPGATHAYLPSCQGNSFGGPTLFAPVVATATSAFVFTVPITVTGETYHCGVYVVGP